jgi:hypothetical protein
MNSSIRMWLLLVLIAGLLALAATQLQGGVRNLAFAVAALSFALAFATLRRRRTT